MLRNTGLDKKGIMNGNDWGKFHQIPEKEYLKHGIAKLNIENRILENLKNRIMSKPKEKLCIKTLERVMMDIESYMPQNGPHEYVHGQIQAYTSNIVLIQALIIDQFAKESESD